MKVNTVNVNAVEAAKRLQAFFASEDISETALALASRDADIIVSALWHARMDQAKTRCLP